MTPDEPSRKPRRPRAVPPSSSSVDMVGEELLSLLGQQLGEVIQKASTAPQGRGRRLTKVTAEYVDEPSTVHSMAGPNGYSIASNWFTQRMAQLLVANAITGRQLAVFLYVAGGQKLGTGITEYTQQEITDGLNELAACQPGTRKVSRPTVNRAVNRLCELRWLESAGNGRIRLNAHLWFSGNSSAQREVLAEITRSLPAEADPADYFPNQIGPPLIHHQEELDLELGDLELPAPRPRRRTG
ncbi:MarR family transcriptional regulator [Streptomyces hydrogenans]|uniref:MarR family transcriptional regulator n=1 Tax=Streptomyces hydrogenans TaxID=1873719 RepID=UPI003436BD6D